MHPDLRIGKICSRKSFTQAWKSLPAFNHQAKITTWLYRVALNTAMTHRRSAAQKKHVALEEHQDISLLADDSEEPDLIQIIYHIIQDLPMLDRALMLLYLEDRSYHEISEIMGISASNVGTRLNRIREKIKYKASHLNK